MNTAINKLLVRINNKNDDTFSFIAGTLVGALQDNESSGEILVILLTWLIDMYDIAQGS